MALLPISGIPMHSSAAALPNHNHSAGLSLLQQHQHMNHSLLLPTYHQQYSTLQHQHQQDLPAYALPPQLLPVGPSNSQTYNPLFQPTAPTTSMGTLQEPGSGLLGAMSGRLMSEEGEQWGRDGKGAPDGAGGGEGGRWQVAQDSRHGDGEWGEGVGQHGWMAM